MLGIQILVLMLAQQMLHLEAISPAMTQILGYAVCPMLLILVLMR